MSPFESAFLNYFTMGGGTKRRNGGRERRGEGKERDKEEGMERLK